MRKWRATGRVFDRFEYLILLKTPHLDFGKWRLHQVEVLGCYCDHEGLCAQIDRAKRCGDVITLRGFATRIKRPDPTGKTHGVSLIVTGVHAHFANSLRRLRSPALDASKKIVRLDPTSSDVQRSPFDSYSRRGPSAERYGTFCYSQKLSDRWQGDARGSKVVARLWRSPDGAVCYQEKLNENWSGR